MYIIFFLFWSRNLKIFFFFGSRNLKIFFVWVQESENSFVFGEGIVSADPETFSFISMTYFQLIETIDQLKNNSKNFVIKNALFGTKIIVFRSRESENVKC